MLTPIFDGCRRSQVECRTYSSTGLLDSARSVVLSSVAFEYGVDSSAERDLRISVVIPVYNSADIIGRTVDRTRSVFEALPWELELILVNDGSADRSWSVIEGLASEDKQIISIDLLKNFGQHNANLCGIREATGDYLITMDDDLQNPPEEIERLVTAAIDGGHDVVFGRFRQKQAPFVRRLGTQAMDRVNVSVFNKPPPLTVSNFRVLHRSVYRRIAESPTVFPYITGQALMHCGNPANVEVEHHQREVGASGYSPLRILSLLAQILFSYSVAPLRAVGLLGVGVSAVSMTLGGAAAARSIFLDSPVPGWTSTVVLLSFLNGVVILMLAMIGEYLIRTLQQVSHVQPYTVRSVVDHRG